MMDQLNKWQKELNKLTQLSEKQANDALFKYYRQALIDIKKDMKGFMDEYETLSFSKKLEAERMMDVASQIDSAIKKAYSSAGDTIAKHVTDEAERGYYGAWYALEGAENIQMAMPLLNERYIESLVNKKVQGANFSKRLYKHRTKLANSITSELLNGVRTGKGYAHVAKNVSEMTESSYKQALRIARTEGGRVQSTAKQKSYEEAEKQGVELQKRWLASLDKRTRHSHQELDGQTVDVDEEFEFRGNKAEAPKLFGIASLDINCRCTTIAIVNGIEPELRRSGSKTFDYKNYDEWKNEKTGKIKQTAKDFADSINMKTATKDDIIKLGQMVNAEYKVTGAIGDKNRLKDVFSNFREIGNTVTKTTWAKGSKRPIKERLGEAFLHYPAEWVDMLDSIGKQLYASSSKRGFFVEALTDARGHLKTKVEGNQTDFFSIYLSDRETVAYHEIGHLIETLNEDLLRVEKEFVEYRTKNEQEVLMKDLFPGWGYEVREVTKKDNFISPYIGKTYSDATEVLSMGLESLFVSGNKQCIGLVDGKWAYKTIADDEEFLNLIIGLIIKG